MKNFIIIALLSIIFCFPAYAQNISVTIGSASANPGDTVYIPIKVTNLNNVGAISLVIEFDVDKLTYYGVLNAPGFGSFTNNLVDNKIIFGWFSNTPLSLGNGKLTDIAFIFNGDKAEINFDLPSSEIADINGNVILVEFNNGIITNKTVGIETPQTVMSFALEQNYPNPFNPETTIRYFLPSPAVVDLSIYKITGEFVICLISEYKPAGNYKVRFTSGSLASGMYIYKIKAGGFVQSRTMMLIK